MGDEEIGMRNTALVLALAAFPACGGEPKDCDFSKISGTYRVSLDEKGGDCGDVDDFNVLLDAGNEQAGQGCTIAAATQSEARCTTDVDMTCDDTADGLRFHQVLHLVAQPDGSSMTGSITISFYRLSNGTPVCTSTYDVDYDRL
jgi:hypothetical protein